MNSTEFDRGQQFAAKQAGKRWAYIAGLKQGDELRFEGRNGVETARFVRVRPRNRKYPVIIECGQKVYKLCVFQVVLPDDDGTTKALSHYIDNLRCRSERRPFGGLPEWQREKLKDSDEILPDRLCDEVEVPKGSTVGFSIRHGQHFLDLSHTYLD